jgi:hypothetical protein
MRNRTKLAITALAAAAALGALVSTASARNLSISNQNIRATYRSNEFGASGGGVTLRCELTLEGSFHTNTIVKNVGALVGYITRAIVRRPCTGGTVWAHSGETNEILGGTFANTLPWHIRYDGFTGTLPAIASVRIRLENIQYTARAAFFGIPILCAYNSAAANGGNATATANREAVTGALTTLTPSGIVRSSTGGCPEGQFGAPAGDGPITLLGTTTRLTVTLI